MKLSQDEVRELWLEERFEFCFATEEQVEALCEELGHDRPQMRWDDYQEEMDCLMADAFAEFA